MSLGPTDPEEIVQFLLDSTPEPFPFARLVAFLTLCAWMRFPDDEEIVLDAQTHAAAMIYLHERKRGITSPIPLNLERTCESIVNRQIHGQYSEVFEEQLAADIVAFFMYCPEERQPSFGKAYHFIGAGGFAPSDVNEAEKKQFTRARSSLKAAWKLQAVSAPLLWATRAFEDDSEVFHYAPDDIDCFDDAAALVRSRERLLTLFGVALFCQQKLTKLLNMTGAAKIRYPTFPRIVKPVVPDIGTFDEKQLRILDDYAAPQ